MAIFLTFHFTYSFSRLIFYARNVFFGCKVRFFHANRASFFLFFIFLHYFRRIYFLFFIAVRRFSACPKPRLIATFNWVKLHLYESVPKNLFGDVENFLEANSLVTPLHIKPEWYFLFAYS